VRGAKSYYSEIALPSINPSILSGFKFHASRLISVYLWPFLPCATLAVFALVILELDVLGLPPLPHVSLYSVS
jgi:hypothetical protein